MNIWENAVITTKGLALQAKLISGTNLNITRAVTGAGYVNPTLLPSQTAVTTPKQTLAFRTISYPAAGKAAVPVYLTNDGITTGYTATQVGFYATDPDEGEILYFIAQANSGTGTVVPSASEMPGFSAEWTFYFQYGQADGVTVIVDPSNTVTQAEVQTMISVHNTSEDAHEGILAPVLDWSNATNANTYKRVYLDPAGNDSNPGTQASPMATIIGAIRKYADANKWLDIFMNDGTYTQEIGTISTDNCDIAIRSTSEDKDKVTINVSAEASIMIDSLRLYNITINETAAGNRPISINNGRLYAYGIRVNVPTNSTVSCINVYNGSSAFIYNCILNGTATANSGACVYGNQALWIKAINCKSERTVGLGFYAYNASYIEYTATVTATQMTKEQTLGKCVLTSARPVVASSVVDGTTESD